MRCDHDQEGRCGYAVSRVLGGSRIMPNVWQRITAEIAGTFGLVLFGCGTAVLTADHLSADGRQLGVGFLGVAMAFGVTVMVLVYALGPVSGGHFNPAVTLGLTLAGRFPLRHLSVYVAAQVAGAVGAAGVLYVIASGTAGFDAVGSGFASNGYGERSPGGYTMGAAFLTETIMTMIFVLVVLAVTGRGDAPAIGAPAIGLCLMIIHLVSIPVTNTSVNPARSLGPALFAGTPAMGQLWLFLLAPALGAAIAGAAYPLLSHHRRPARSAARDQQMVPSPALSAATAE
ncbi:aquaporin Z [Actinoplanes sp. NPDC051859]|uniref:aquaporin Z n=1 Tax=Actinoplanes sp. NPDC051859 TaxID=3363909 RepID=UPI0037A215AE